MRADATIFDTDDLSEPGFGGQVVATSKIGGGFNCYYDSLSGNAIRAHYSERRVFKRIDKRIDEGIWEDRTREQFFFSDLVDIVILNRGEQL